MRQSRFFRKLDRALHKLEVIQTEHGRQVLKVLKAYRALLKALARTKPAKRKNRKRTPSAPARLVRFDKQQCLPSTPTPAAEFPVAPAASVPIDFPKAKQIKRPLPRRTITPGQAKPA